MKIKENKNFRHVSVFSGFSLTETTLLESKTAHMQDPTRAARIAKALELDKNPEIDQMFLVDKGHRDGMEVHVVTKNGLIYVYNNMKLFMGQQALVTILIARPNQVKRLYEACNLKVCQEILSKCDEYKEKGFNVI